MDLALSELHQTIRDTARTFARAEVAPAAARWDAEQKLPAALWAQLGELGLLGITVPEEQGGAGLDGISLALVVEELARADGGLGLLVGVHNGLAAAQVVALGDEATRAQLLPALAAGERLGGFCMDGRGAAGELRAQRDGDGWRLDGRAPFVAPADAALVVLDAATEEGPALFAVDADADGVSRARIEGLGFRSMGLVDLTFDGARLEAGRRLGAPAEGAALAAGSVATAAVLLGVGEGALEAAVAYAKDREQFGQPIAGFQAIQWMIADARTELDAARVLVWRAASELDAGARAQPAHAAMARQRASEAAAAAAHKALQIHGGYGYTRDFPVERQLRDASSAEALLGGRRSARSAVAPSA